MNKVMLTLRITERAFGLACIAIGVAGLIAATNRAPVTIGIGAFLSGFLTALGVGVALPDTDSPPGA